MKSWIKKHTLAIIIVCLFIIIFLWESRRYKFDLALFDFSINSWSSISSFLTLFSLLVLILTIREMKAQRQESYLPRIFIEFDETHVFWDMENKANIHLTNDKQKVYSTPQIWFTNLGLDTATEIKINITYDVKQILRFFYMIRNDLQSQGVEPDDVMLSSYQNMFEINHDHISKRIDENGFLVSYLYIHSKDKKSIPILGIIDPILRAIFYLNAKYGIKYDGDIFNLNFDITYKDVYGRDCKPMNIKLLFVNAMIQKAIISTFESNFESHKNKIIEGIEKNPHISREKRNSEVLNLIGNTNYVNCGKILFLLNIE
jgi:hypothetical protein